MDNDRTVSVVIPSYNMGWSLSRAIRSCQKQTHPVHELIIVDDGSTDDTRQIVTHEASKDSRIHHIALPSNTGCAAAMITGIRKATGEWIAFLDADDELTPTSVADRLSVLKRQTGKQPGLIYGHVYVNRVSDQSMVRFSELNGHCYPYVCKELSLCAQIVMMVRRECFFKAGFPSPEIPSSTDDDMVLTIAKHFPVACVSKPVAIIHSHDSPTRMTNDRLRVARGAAMLVRKYQSDIVRYHGRFYLALWWLRVARAYISAEQQRGAVGLLTNTGWHLSLGLLSLRLLAKTNTVAMSGIYRLLDAFLRRHFDHMYFSLLIACSLALFTSIAMG